MKKPENRKYRNYILLVCIFLLVIGALWWKETRIKIDSMALSSPDNSALMEDIDIQLNIPASVYVEYWADEGKRYQTPLSSVKNNHNISLVLLKPDTKYHFKVVIHQWFNRSTKVKTFKTRALGKWMVHNWVNSEKPHDAKALGNGLVMLCYGGKPGYVAMVDGKGDIRWYWQCDTLGVRAATLTPRNTLLVLLHPTQLDELNDVPDKSKREKLNKLKYPIRRGRIGYTGGTAFAEVDLTGKVLWKVDIDQDKLGYLSIHHDLRMDKEHHIMTLIHDPLPYDLSSKGGKRKDTLWGDALVKLDTTGKILWKWSPWSDWNFKDDSLLNVLSYDRFHLNAVWITKDSNYLISSAIENQIWKIDAETGKVIWKFGKNGDFKMDSSDYFYFQHDVNVLPSGDILIFDNGDNSPFNTSKDKYRFTRLYAKDKNKVSRVLSFHLDTVHQTAQTKINVELPISKYSSRMGSAYVLPNKNILVTSSKTGAVMIMSTEGKILWELDAYFIPYRAEYIPKETWNKYFKIIH